MAFAVIGVLGYLISAAALLLLFFKHYNYQLKIIITPGLLAVVMHTLFIHQHFDLASPDSYNLVLVVNIVSLVVSFASIGFAQKFNNFFVLPVCFVFTAVMLLIGLVAPVDLPTVASWSSQTLSHIGFAIGAYAILTVATLLAFQYRFVSYRLKMHDLSILRLPIPALNEIERQIFQLLITGTLCLTISIITGALFLDNFFGSGQSHKAILSIIAWGCFSCLLLGHAIWGWRGTITLVLTLSGSTLLTLGYFGSRFVRDFIMS
ncbi:hypothetical protein C2869_17115 [Saccharobesus litoralis]|uniref:Cytochrome c assembly protein domain-containing protein n=1 Tax=Saccharobesus litoralis TaxID=2172099 RepID=A0A2S0VUZ9_9ALTE|nr:cytochrome c biogenesis protein CcsA [Saccharobesus litoralis]AWB68039.1 hypothetical protein C2869_17115 [Saccharobesus litoralis]